MNQRPTRRPWLRAVVGLLIGFGGALVTIVAVDYFPNPAAASLQLGTLDFERYCARREGMTALLLVADPYGWQCVGRPARVWTVDPIVPTEVCRWQYEGDAYAVLINPADVAGWVCVRE